MLRVLIVTLLIVSICSSPVPKEREERTFDVVGGALEKCYINCDNKQSTIVPFYCFLVFRKLPCNSDTSTTRPERPNPQITFAADTASLNLTADQKQQLLNALFPIGGRLRNLENSPVLLYNHQEEEEEMLEGEMPTGPEQIESR